VQVGRRDVVLVDGFISGIAALAALRIDPAIAPALLLTHPSAERGSQTLVAALRAYGLPEPPLAMGMRLGEATGALLAVPLTRAACAVLRDMGTLEQTLALAAAP
jgi:nicotinate-nucleotide--dimethylbenzimidazole phosphoribosyltransferase